MYRYMNFVNKAVCYKVWHPEHGARSVTLDKCQRARTNVERVLIHRTVDRGKIVSVEFQLFKVWPLD